MQTEYTPPEFSGDPGSIVAMLGKVVAVVVAPRHVGLFQLAPYAPAACRVQVFSIYAVLGGLLYLTAFSLGADKKKGYVVSVVIGALYAVSDEVHQYFVPGRACMIRDMLLDSAGVAIGAAVLLGLVHLIVKKTNRRSA